MKDYIIWVQADASMAIKVEMTDRARPERLHRVQKEFVAKGYVLTNIMETKDGRMIYAFVKEVGATEYCVCERTNLVPCEEVKS